MYCFPVIRVTTKGKANIVAVFDSCNMSIITEAINTNKAIILLNDISTFTVITTQSLHTM